MGTAEDRPEVLETRPGIRFYGITTETGSDIDPYITNLYVEGQDEPISAAWSSDPDDNDATQKAFKRFLLEDDLFEDDLWLGSGPDRVSAQAMIQAQYEEKYRVPRHQRRQHFIESYEQTEGRKNFILTSDTTHLEEERKRQVLAQWEASGGPARAAAEAAYQARLEAHEPLIREVAKIAIASKTLPTELTQQLINQELLDASTTFRSGVLFPGETFLLRYSFTEDDQEFLGFIGFDQNHKLASVDERSPEDKRTYIEADGQARELPVNV